MTFDGSGSSDADGEIISYIWDFDDGSTSADMITSHIYSTEGEYLATLTVTDDDAAQATSVITIQVNPDPNYVQAPTNLTATVDGNDVFLNWQDNSSNEIGFQIEKAINKVI